MSSKKSSSTSVAAAVFGEQFIFAANYLITFPPKNDFIRLENLGFTEY